MSIPVLLFTFKTGKTVGQGYTSSHHIQKEETVHKPAKINKSAANPFYFFSPISNFGKPFHCLLHLILVQEATQIVAWGEVTAINPENSIYLIRKTQEHRHRKGVFSPRDSHVHQCWVNLQIYIFDIYSLLIYRELICLLKDIKSHLSRLYS